MSCLTDAELDLISACIGRAMDRLTETPGQIDELQVLLEKIRQLRTPGIVWIDLTSEGSNAD